MKNIIDTDLAKRKLLRKIGIGVGAAVAIPLVASFSKDGLLVTQAYAKKGKKKPTKK